MSDGFEAALRDFALESEPWFRTSLRTLVEIPTISPGATQTRDIRTGAEAARELIESCGGQAELVETSGTPAILGRFTHPDARTNVVVYNHMDVQPADASHWTQSDPFKLEVEEHDGRDFLYRARGSTDDKGPALCGLRAAQLVAEQKLPINLCFLWETEEEIGSPNFGEVVRSHRSTLAGDCVIVSDTIWPHDRQPAISVGLRGTMHAILRLRTGTKDVHSGLTGGVARNPLRELCALATAIHGAEFWKEGALTPDAVEINGYMKSGFELDYFKQAHGLLSLETDVPVEILLRLWARPTFEVHGLVGGYIGSGVKTIVPSEGELKVSFRLVPDQDPQALANRLRDFVAAMNPDVEVDVAGYLAPYNGATSGRIHDAIADAMKAAFGTEPVAVREGGSIGAVPIMADVLGVPIHFLPLSLPEHGYHAPNEYFDWKQARGGIEAFGRTFANLAAG